MGDKMTPLSFEQLLNWIFGEKEAGGAVFGLHGSYFAEKERRLSLFGEMLETPFGPAAGPHTQLAQNLAAAYYAGGRFFELKTVQKLDGDDLPVSKPCIMADDEGYNVEWSTELYVPQAFEEYVKAWFLMHLMAKEFGLGASDGFIFNMSVGYDLDGIKTKKIDDFIEGLKDASDTPVFKECMEYALRHTELFSNVSKEDIEQIPAEICSSITLSTLHGCPPQEIERIATYLLTQKQLHTFIKCNPTLLGYEFARKTLDKMGYDYVSFTDFHFKDDLQYEDAVPMLTRLMSLASEKGLEFGVKITNTFPVDIKAGELPGEEMYMSGRALYPLSIALAAKLSEEFDGRLRISYSGGADIHNIEQIVDAGIWPVTMATTALKPGGYARFIQIAKAFHGKQFSSFAGVDVKKAKVLAEAAVFDKHHRKPVKPHQNRKLKKELPLFDCFVAPCQEECPIHQDVMTYMRLVEQGEYQKALEVIMEKNPLPFTTGTICSHRCMSSCTRNFYDDPVRIRQMKLIAAENGYDRILENLTAKTMDKAAGKIAVVGGGPAGISASYFFAGAGFAVTMFCNKETPGGVARFVIPEFRITGDAIEKDISFIKKLGVEIREMTKITSLDEL
ncbi:MAG TPA: putative selenate reductase subunit YgfK, partial [Lachnospiraceae bacterium]|nr:putative selenate reductase subunit YgfK [Lachnospiraceae bacterium]